MTIDNSISSSAGTASNLPGWLFAAEVFICIGTHCHKQGFIAGKSIPDVSATSQMTTGR
jgi:hypothetical protein